MKTNLLLASICLFGMTSCMKEDAGNVSVSESSLGAMAVNSDEFTVMRTTDRSDGKWNIKMNDVAAKAYSEGQVNYPNNSMIVKEKRNSEGEITGYDVMYHSAGGINSLEGWIYSQLDRDGKPLDTDNRSVTCQSCHATDIKFKELH